MPARSPSRASLVCWGHTKAATRAGRACRAPQAITAWPPGRPVWTRDARSACQASTAQHARRPVWDALLATSRASADRPGAPPAPQAHGARAGPACALHAPLERTPMRRWPRTRQRARPAPRERTQPFLVCRPSTFATPVLPARPATAARYRALGALPTRSTIWTPNSASSARRTARACPGRS